MMKMVEHQISYLFYPDIFSDSPIANIPDKLPEIQESFYLEHRYNISLHSPSRISSIFLIKKSQIGAPLIAAIPFLTYL